MQCEWFVRLDERYNSTDTGLVAGLNTPPPYSHSVYATMLLLYCKLYSDQ